MASLKLWAVKAASASLGKSLSPQSVKDAKCISPTSRKSRTRPEMMQRKRPDDDRQRVAVPAHPSGKRYKGLLARRLAAKADPLDVGKLKCQTPDILEQRPDSQCEWSPWKSSQNQALNGTVRAASVPPPASITPREDQVKTPSTPPVVRRKRLLGGRPSPLYEAKGEWAEIVQYQQKLAERERRDVVEKRKKQQQQFRDTLREQTVNRDRLKITAKVEKERERAIVDEEVKLWKLENEKKAAEKRGRLMKDLEFAQLQLREQKIKQIEEKKYWQKKELEVLKNIKAEAEKEALIQEESKRKAFDAQLLTTTENERLARERKRQQSQEEERMKADILKHHKVEHDRLENVEKRHQLEAKKRDFLQQTLARTTWQDMQIKAQEDEERAERYRVEKERQRDEADRKKEEIRRVKEEEVQRALAEQLKVRKATREREKELQRQELEQHKWQAIEAEKEAKEEAKRRQEKFAIYRKQIREQLEENERIREAEIMPSEMSDMERKLNAKMLEQIRSNCFHEEKNRLVGTPLGKVPKRFAKILDAELPSPEKKHTSLS